MATLFSQLNSLTHSAIHLTDKHAALQFLFSRTSILFGSPTNSLIWDGSWEIRFKTASLEKRYFVKFAEKINSHFFI